MRRAGGAIIGVVVSFAAAGWMGCGGDEAPAASAAPEAAAKQTAKQEIKNRAPVIESVRLSPRDAKPGDLVNASVKTSDPDGHKVTLGYTWHLGDDRLAGGNSAIAVPSTAKRGERLRVSVVATDKKDTSSPTEASIDVGNTPPEWQEFALNRADKVFPGSELTIVATATDHDGDPVEFETRWYVNGKLHRERGTVFDTTKLKRGDEVYAVVLAADRTDTTEEKETEKVVIANADPKIVSAPGRLSQDGSFFYQVEVEDPDRDRRFRYSLASAPPGMIIDSSFGEITWKATEEHRGSHTVEIVATDLYGGEARQKFDLTVGIRVEEIAPASPGNDADEDDF